MILISPLDILSKGRVDFGMDVTNCAVCAAFARHDAKEVVPYLCALDDRMSVTLGMGLRRTGTRALGASCCDFRYQAGGEPKTLASQHASLFSLNRPR